MIERKVSYNVRALCRCGIRIPSARNRCPSFDKDKCLEPMFGDAGQARTNAAILLLPIATTSSRTCTKPTVICSLSFHSLDFNFPFNSDSFVVQPLSDILSQPLFPFWMNFRMSKGRISLSKISIWSNQIRKSIDFLLYLSP